MKKVVLSLFLLASLVSANEEVEVIGGVVIVEDGVTVVVQSGGCTRKEDFEVVVVNKNEDEPAEILISRVRYDFCKRVPFLEEIHFSYGDLGVDQNEDFRIINPISTRINYHF